MTPKRQQKLPREYWVSGGGARMIEAGMAVEEIAKQSGASLLAVRKARLRLGKRAKSRPAAPSVAGPQTDRSLVDFLVRGIADAYGGIRSSQFESWLVEQYGLAVQRKIGSVERSHADALERIRALEQEKAALQVRVDRERLKVAGGTSGD